MSSEFVEATVDSLDLGQARSFVVVVLVVLPLLLLLVAVLNVVVDPFAAHGTAVLPPVTASHRHRKDFLLRQHAPRTLKLLVLGSSRSMTLDPAQLEDATGFPGFNAAVGSAETQDYLAWYRFFCRLNETPPSMVVIGVDVVAFTNRTKVEASFSGPRALLEMVPEIGQRRATPPVETADVGWDRTVHSLLSLSYVLFGYPPENERFGPDGLASYVKWDRQIAAKTFDLSRQIERSLREYESRFDRFSQLSERRLELFETLLDEIRDQGGRVIAYLTPLHPEFHRQIDATTESAARRNELRKAIRPMLAVRDFHYFDATNIESYGGSADGFYDGVHIGHEEARKLVYALLRVAQPAGKAVR